MPISFKYTETFKSTLRSTGLKKDSIRAILLAFEQKLMFFPECCPVPIFLANQGITRYRAYQSPEKYSIFYTYSTLAEKKGIVTAHVITHQRQDIQNQLFIRLLEY